MHAVPAPHYSTANPPRESHAGPAPPPPTLPLDGSRSPTPRNSLRRAASVLETASPPPSSHLPPRDSEPAAESAPVAPSPPSKSTGYPPSCSPTPESNLPKSRRELLQY